MSAQQILESLIAQGFTKQGSYFWRKSSGLDCECNEKPPTLVVEQWKFDDLPVKNYTVELRGEAGGVWYSVSAFTVREPDLLDCLAAIEKRLTLAWNAIVSTERSPALGLERAE